MVQYGGYVVVCLLGTLFGLIYSRSAHPPGLVWVALCFSNISGLRDFFLFRWAI